MHTRAHMVGEHPTCCPNMRVACAHTHMCTHMEPVHCPQMHAVMCMHPNMHHTLRTLARCTHQHSQAGRTSYPCCFLTLEEGMCCHHSTLYDPPAAKLTLASAWHHFLLWRGCAGTSLL